MKNLLVIFAFSLFWNVNTMIPEQDSSENSQELMPFPRLRPIKSIPAVKYYIEKPTLDLLIVPSWHWLVLKNKVFWVEICLKGSRYENIELYAPLRIHSNMPSDKIIDSLIASFHPQKIEFHKKFIPILY